jgi:hypothetical protein
MLLRVPGQLEDAFPPGIETQGDVEDVLRLVARMILELYKHPEYLGFLRMVVPTRASFPGSPRSSPPSWSLKLSGSRAISPI